MSLKAETLPYHSPPGNLDDLSPDNKKIWSEQYISAWMKQEITAKPPLPGPCSTFRTPLSQFFDGTVQAFDVGQTPTPITWNAFPNRVKVQYPDDNVRWAIADYSRMVQDEYCEWSVARDSDNNITSVTFTCEGPEYWQCIADWQGRTPAVGKSVLQLYRGLNPGAGIDEGDLYLTDQKTGQTVYNPLNFWNCTSTSGTIAHLIHPANTLSAEIDIVAQATVMRMDKNGQKITEELKLIQCSKYGQPLRNSDPFIGISTNNAASAGNAVSLQDPVGLYINAFQASRFTLDNEPIDKIPGVVSWTRGSLPQGLRFTISIPSTRPGKTVSDIVDTFTGNSINFGAQFADAITMGVNAVTIPNWPVAALEPCPCDKAAVSGDAADDAQKGHIPYKIHRTI